MHDKLPKELAGHRLAYNDWIFNAWGNKYEELKQDDSIPKRLESLLKLPRFEPGIVMEGGSIEVNGAGCVLTTEQCLLNPKPKPASNQERNRTILERLSGSRKVLWLGEGIVGDDTDGHIDDIARFVAPNVIVCAVEDDPEDANYELLQDNLDRLQDMTDADGRPFEIVTLPMPGVIGGASTDNENLIDCRRVMPISTLRTMSCLPRSLGSKRCAGAGGVAKSCFPIVRVVGINCEPLVWGMGTIHCVTQQQPAIGD